MKVLSDSTEKYDRNRKMQLYCKVGVSEYWIADWRKKQVEIYMFDWKDDDTSYPYLPKNITEQIKMIRSLSCFPISGSRLMNFLTLNRITSDSHQKSPFPHGRIWNILFRTKAGVYIKKLLPSTLP